MESRLTSRRAWLIGAGALLCAPDAAAREAREARSARALLIAASYQGGRLALANTRNDAALIAASLRRLRFASIERVDDPDPETMRARFGAYVASLNRNEIAFVYIAAHGVQVDGENYILMNDGRTFVSLSSIIATLRAASDTVVLLLDACRNNPFAALPNGARGVGAARGISAEMVLRPEDLNPQSTAIGPVGALELQGAGVLVAYATDPRNTAADAARPGDGNSPFALAIAEHITDTISLNDVIANASTDVIANTNGAQSPWTQGSIRPIFLAGPERVRVPPVPG